MKFLLATPAERCDHSSAVNCAHKFVAAMKVKMIGTYCKVASDAVVLEQGKVGAGALPAGIQQLSHLMTKLEGSRFKAQVASWRDF